MELTNEDGLKRYKRIDAQLRRPCERKPSGRLNVPLSVHEMWSKGGKDRDELRMMFEQYELNKDPNCMHAWYLIDMLILFLDTPSLVIWFIACSSIYIHAIHILSLPSKLTVGHLSHKQFMSTKFSDQRGINGYQLFLAWRRNS